MTIERFQLLRNVGQFENVDAGADIPLNRLTLVYAENGRGKTTLASILRSLSIGDPAPIEGRHRLRSVYRPHIVLSVGGAQLVYQNGAWGRPLPNITVFDDLFVGENICSGIEIETIHRQNLHEFILGAQGVALNTKLQHHIDAIERHNRDLRAKEAEIPVAQRSGMSVEAFCALPIDDDIDGRIQVAERKLSAAKSASAIQQRHVFMPLTLPSFDLAAIDDVLARTLPDVQMETLARVRAHFRNLGHAGEAWVGEGMSRASTKADDTSACPFCAQDLAGSTLIRHYEVYFGETYNSLKSAITNTGKGVAAEHSGDIQAAFERAVRIIVENREFWRHFTKVPDVDLDTATILQNWTAARDAVLTVLRAKAAAPLEAMTLGPIEVTAVTAFSRDAEVVAALSDTLSACNEQIAMVKELAVAANLELLAAELARLQAIKARNSPPLDAACATYLAEKAAKAKAVSERNAARAELDKYRHAIFPAYEQTVNDYLGRFNAGYRWAGLLRLIRVRDDPPATT